MSQVVTAIFDGQVFRPDQPLPLKPNQRYVIKIEAETSETVTEDAWDVLESLAGTVDAPTDWSVEHDHYLYGTPKHYSESD